LLLLLLLRLKLLLLLLLRCKLLLLLLLLWLLLGLELLLLLLGCKLLLLSLRLSLLLLLVAKLCLELLLLLRTELPLLLPRCRLLAPRPLLLGLVRLGAEGREAPLPEPLLLQERQPLPRREHEALLVQVKVAHQHLPLPGAQFLRGRRGGEGSLHRGGEGGGSHSRHRLELSRSRCWSR